MSDFIRPKKRKVIWERTKDMVGRPRKKGVERYKSGAITRKAREEDVMAVAIWQRVKLGMTEEAARSDLGGFLIGRMHQAKLIQRHHLEAAERYHADMERWIGLNGIGRGTAKTSKLFEMIGGMSLAGEPDDETIRRAKSAVAEAQGAVLNGSSLEGRQAIDLLNKVIVRDEGPTTMNDHVLGLIRLALNILARHYRVPI